MDALADPVERIAADTWFSGVVRVDWDGEVRLAKAYGLAHRGWGVANTVTTRFAIASVTKGPTALTVVGLIEDGRLAPGHDRPDQAVIPLVIRPQRTPLDRTALAGCSI
jgi:CubicO group peptidase (beta-lactamase class C family)